MSFRHAVVVTLLFLFARGARALEVPYLSGRVTDNAEILSDQARRQLSARLKEHEARTQDQVVVLTVPDLQGESIEEYAVEVFSAWKLGQQGKDNGVLLLVAPQSRQMRIEVGYGLEGKLTDVASSRIIRNVIAPRFKENDFDRGMLEGAQAIVDVLEGDEDAQSAVAAVAKTEEAASGLPFEGPDLPISARILLGAFIFGIIGLFTVLGVLTPGVGWFLYFFLIPFWAMFPIIVVGTTGALWLLGIYVTAFPVAKLVLSRTAWYQKARGDLASKGRASIGGFTLSSGHGSSSPSWSSGSSSGSSFSGGGGRSGGGGASGSW